MGFAPPIIHYSRCPRCRQDLKPVERITESRVPSTVPEGHPRTALYRRTTRWTRVRCKNGHEFKKTGLNSLYGKDYDLGAGGVA